MSNSISQQIPTSQASDPAMVMITSNPSIKVVNGNRSIMMKIVCIIFMLAAVAALFVSMSLYKNKKVEVVKAKESAEAAAAEVKHLVPQSYTPDEEDTDNQPAAAQENKFISLSLFTTPAGADVYANSMFIGVTPLEQLQMPKSDENLDLLVFMEGYELVRKSIPLSENYSDALTLTEKVFLNVKVDNAGTGLGDGVSENKGFDVTTKDNHVDSHSNIGTIDTGIVLPD